MSWMKRRTPTATPSPGLQTTPPPVQMYNPNQHSNSDWQQSPANNWYNQPSVQSVPTMPTVNEQNSQVLQPNTYWQQQQHQQYPTQQPPPQQQQYQYGNTQQSQNNYYQQQVPPQQPNQLPPQQTQQSYEYNNMQYQQQQQQQHGYQNYVQPAVSSHAQYDQSAQQQQQQQQQQQPPPQQIQQNDGWNKSWGWGDEDNSNVNNVHNANTVGNPIGNVANVTNAVADGFNDESWNWNVDENSIANSASALRSETNKERHDSGNSEQQIRELFPKMSSSSSKVVPKSENLETVPLLPSLPINKRIKSEVFSPQWSIESQVSQESSDDILQTSESDKLFSRSSTISHSPVSGHHTPQEPVVEESCENKEIVSNVKEDDSKPLHLPPSLPPVGAASGSGGENPYKRSGAKPQGDMRNFYMNQSVNLETVPDNSEAPDLHLQQQQQQQPEVKSSPSIGVENNEVAPLNERNQYLETGQLSDENDALPPPGLSRMVLGQLGQGEVNEPPVGLSRMVLGQTEGAQSTASPPVGLHRMVPGESSSPEVRYDEEEASDPELLQMGRNPLQSRSATIGADTPPAPPTNGAEQVEREMNLDGANTQDSTGTNVDTLTSSIRDLTVGENTSDGRQASESDVDRATSPVDRRRKEEGSRRDTRYSPARDGRDSRDVREKSRTDRRKNRDRGFDDDTDYFSDKERDRKRDREDPDKKYSSLRRGERDSDRRRRNPRDDRERGNDRRSEYSRRDRDYYYNRYNDEYDDSHRSSRPSSRSDSMHDSYYRNSRTNDRRREHGDRDPHRHRDRDHRGDRDPYNMYKMHGYPYDAYNPYYQQYQYYLENLRRTDPAAYAEYYRKYYSQVGAASSTYTQEEKTSVHSGRSSTNDDLAKERYLRQNYYGHASYTQMGGYYREPQSVSSAQYGLDESRPYDYTDSSLLLEDSTVSQRLTPAKFSTAHIKSSITSGRLVKILPHYPMDGQSAVVELERLQDLLQNDDELIELEQFPGPLARGVTHKKTIIEYCNNKIRGIQDGVNGALKEVDDPDSYILMWELLILLIRQNGMVVGADIAELLMKDRNTESILPRPASVASNSSGVVEVSEGSTEPASSQLKEEYVTRKFREYLLYGSVQQALEWAMKHSLWGHALFLASKLDKRTYAKVMTRFANGLPMNDPLQTLYQLLSGHLPAAVTSVSDEKWGDWRPHLAMILSNTMQRPELDRKAITTLGDTLMGRGSLYAAQFCYLMAEVGFTRYGQDGKLVLLGGNQSKPFMQFAHNEAIHMTEIYEYACSLNDAAFKIPEFQAYKYLLATRLADRGFLETSLAYIEQVSIALVANPTVAQPSLINKVCDLADKLKYYDPTDYQDVDDPQLQAGDERPDQSWLQELKGVQQQYAMGLISHESVNNLTVMTPDTTALPTQQSYDQSPQDPWSNQPQTQYVDNQTNNWQQQSTENDYNQQHGIQQQQLQQETNVDSYNAYPEQTWNTQPQQQQQWSPDTQQSPLEVQQSQSDQTSPQANDYWNNAQIEPAEAKKEPDQPRPQISMPNQGRQQRTSMSENVGPEMKKPPKEVEKKPTNASSTGWFGGIWSKLALRPKNQMKLPDDKNPTIVWDQEKKRWMNLDEDNADGAAELKPPPKMADMRQAQQPPGMPQMQQMSQMPQQQQQHQQPQSLPNLNQFGGMATPSQPQSLDSHPQSDAKPPLPSQNMFKMQRGRNLKKSYVDVFNPSGKPPSAGSSSDFNAPAMPAANAAPMNFFVPAPMDPNAPVDFLTPSGMTQQEPHMQSHQS
ncbi:protein transport protein Sec16A isoform X4 [Atheta coriaria]|uniref:protein transport protein Sec16A isoform X4 n=1 Tax=Dalotia coriaria TaxID=877792 RepID=UPI0031F40427